MSNALRTATFALLVSFAAPVLTGCTLPRSGTAETLTCTGELHPSITKSYHIYRMDGACSSSDGESAHYYVNATWKAADRTFTELGVLGANLIVSHVVHRCTDDPYLTDAACQVIEPGANDLAALAADYGFAIPAEYLANPPLGRHVFRQLASDAQVAALAQQAAAKENPALAAPACTSLGWYAAPTLLQPEPEALFSKPQGNPAAYVYVTAPCARDDRHPNSFRIAFERWDETAKLWAAGDVHEIPSGYVPATPPYSAANDTFALANGRWRVRATLLYDDYSVPEGTPPGQIDMKESSQSNLVTFFVGPPTIEFKADAAHHLADLPDLAVSDFKAVKLAAGQTAAGGEVVAQTSWELSWLVKNVGKTPAPATRLAIQCDEQEPSSPCVEGVDGVYDVQALGSSAEAPANEQRVYARKLVRPQPVRWRLKARADFGNHVAERAELNNLGEWDFSLSGADALAINETAISQSLKKGLANRGHALTVAPRRLHTPASQPPAAPAAATAPAIVTSPQSPATKLERIAPGRAPGSGAAPITVVIKPRCSVESIVLKPAKPVEGQVTAVDVLVVNKGKVAVPAGQKIFVTCTVRSGGPGCPVQEDSQALLKPLAPGARTTLTFTGPARSVAGNYLVRATPEGNPAGGKDAPVLVRPLIKAPAAKKLIIK